MNYLGKIFVLSLLIAAVLQGGEYYVSPKGSDNNPGTLQYPWKTFGFAALSTHPGSTVYFREGIYYEKVVIKRGGTSQSKWVEFTAYPGEKPILSGKYSPQSKDRESDSLIYITECNYIKIRGFEMRDLMTEDGAAVHIEGGGHDFIIEENTIHEIRGGGDFGGAGGIWVFGTNPNIPLENIVIQNNEIYNADPAKSEAIALNGNVRIFKVTRNKVHHVNNIGIDFIGGELWTGKERVREGVCTHNTVFDAHSPHEGGYAAGIYVDGGKDIWIAENEVFHCDLGIEVGAENPGVVASGIDVLKNQIHDNDKAGLIFGGFGKEAGRVENCRFQSNEIFGNDTKNTGVGEIWVQHASHNRVEENTITPRKGIAMTVSKGSISNLFNRNNYCKSLDGGPLRFHWKGKEYIGLKAFRKTGEEAQGKECLSEESL